MTNDETERDACTCHPMLPLTPVDGWTLETLPLGDLPQHTELIRGVLVMSPQTVWHAEAVSALMGLIEAQCPQEYLVQRRAAVRWSARTAPEPDISVVRAAAYGHDRYFYLPEDVVLAAEVVSAESEERDREDKPILYASMGIPTFWQIEQEPDDSVIVREHRLYGGVYQLMEIHSGRLVTNVPFPIDIPLLDPPLRQ